MKIYIGIIVKTQILNYFSFNLSLTKHLPGRDYQYMLEVVCSEVGTESDDGDAIVDKYSGYILRKKDLSTEEGYDDSGHKLVSRDLLEKDFGVIREETKKKQRIFENEFSELLHNVLNSITNNLDVPIDSIEDMVLRHTSILINKNLLSEAKYQKRVGRPYLKKTESLGSYENIRMKHL